MAINMGKYKDDKPLILTPYKNGGWVITQDNGGMGAMPDNIGAYSNSLDMLDALKFELIGGDE